MYLIVRSGLWNRYPENSQDTSVHVSYIFRSGVRDRYPEDDPDGEIPAVRHGSDRGPVQVCLHGRAPLPGNGAATQAGRGGQ